MLAKLKLHKIHFHFDLLYILTTSLYAQLGILTPQKYAELGILTPIIYAELGFLHPLLMRNLASYIPFIAMDAQFRISRGIGMSSSD